MKKIIYILALSGILMSCEDFLQRNPQDFGSEEAFFKDVMDLEYAANAYYELLPKFGTWAGGLYKDDENSDNQVSGSPNNLFYKGDKRHPDLANSQWKFTTIRNVNYAINEINKRKAEGSIAGGAEQIDHYLGELYFFRAYDYFRLLQNLGDVPIITEVLSENFDELVQKSKRMPRNEVARFILDDLKMASSMMLEKAPAEGRLSKDAALLMSARVALFEATWLKYHANTPFVPGYANSPYSKKWGGYSYPSGSIESESNYFFDIAIANSDSVASKRTLDVNYQRMFNNTSGSFNGQEVILARYYVKGINGHSATNLLGRSGGGTGYTNDLIKSFLLINGKPIYASTNQDEYRYNGDAYTFYEMINRDFRLQMSLKPSGYVEIDNPETGKTDTLCWRKPPILSTGNEGNPTGYEVNKYVSFEDGQDNSGAGTSATPIFRAAEAYLIYIEAYYERFHNLGGNCDKYWKDLRKRAGFIDTDYRVTINYTDLNKERDLAKYSGKDHLVDNTLYNIRRERRCEFIAEGMRLMDLKRWRSLDNMQDYIVKGFNLWDQMYKSYGVDLEPGKNVSANSSASGPYVQPFGIVSSNAAYLGYNFQTAHYLEPIPVSEFRLTATGGDITTSPLHQNPGWSNATVGPAADNNDPSLK